ncbi:MAG: hypothetical protein LBS92_05935 [Candidatus Methanoplasma sp.]|nr:hypothetical protein [Candidatus Methanoplasma sp.]
MVLRARHVCGACGAENDFLYGTALNYDVTRLFRVPDGWRTPRYERRDCDEAVRLLVLDDEVAEASYDALTECDDLPMKSFCKHDDFVCTGCGLVQSHFFFFLRRRDGSPFTPAYKCRGCGGRMRLAEAYVRQFGEIERKFRCEACGTASPMDAPDDYEVIDYRITECLKL